MPSETPLNNPPSTLPEASGPRQSLTDFVDVRTLQELQDSFTALTRFTTRIHDADGRCLTAPTDTASRGESDQVLDWLIADGAAAEPDMPLTAPIIVEGIRLGSIALVPAPETPATPQLAAWNSAPPGVSGEANRAAAVQFLYLMANTIARLCYQEHQLRKRIDELSTLYTLSTILAQQREPDHILKIAAKEAAETFHVKAVGIRLMDEARREMRTQCVHNLSQVYLDKGPILLEKSAVFQQALREGIAYVADMRTDPRIIYPDDAQRESLASQLCAGIVFKNEPIGVIQLFSGAERTFSRYETDLLKAMAQLLATAVNNARQEDKRHEAERVERQLSMAVDVQKRMLPQSLPRVTGFDIAARYVPSFELGGDFYDLIDLADNLGIAIADVSGKGIAASLLMASVRSSLRAYAQDVYDLEQIMARVNVALSRDTRANEFTTLFYGVLDPKTRRFTYCNGGHEPPLLLRKGKISRLEAGGMVVGIDPQQRYDKGLLDLQPNDVVLFYTDGVMDAMNFDQHRFGRDRVIKALTEIAAKPAQDIVNHILWEMRRFVGLNPRTDDVTLVALKCKG